MPSFPWQRVPREQQAVPESSLLLCGLPTSLTAASSLKWEVGPVPDPHLTTATRYVGGRPLTLFRYMPPADAHPAAVPPRRLHGPLNLLDSNSGFLFVHDPASADIEESIQCMHQYMELQLRYGGRGFWVLIVTPRGALIPSGRDSVAARFDDELSKYSVRAEDSISVQFDHDLQAWPEVKDSPEDFRDFARSVLQLPVEDACGVVGDTILTSSRRFLPKLARNDSEAPQELSDQDFRDAFLRGRIAPWKHKDYIRAAYLTLLRRENQDVSLLDVATKFASEVNQFKQRNSQFQLLPESRTMTVFWLYQVKLAISAVRIYHQHVPDLISLTRVIHYFPELMDEKLPASYYSPDMLKSPDAEKFWMLPNLRELVEPLRSEDSKFRERLTREQHEDPERLLRFALAVVQRYLRPGETRRRSWFINLAFASLQKHMMQLRTMRPLASPFSETQSYFYIQLVHAALSQLISAGKGELVQQMSYALFKETFQICPSAWTAYYTPKLWDSLEARARFVPPDVKPLPDTIEPPKSSLDADPSAPDRNEPFRKLGLVPELPSFEILHFYQAVLLEDAKSIQPALTPPEVTTHAHLLKYIHTHLIQPTHSGAPAPTRASLLPLFRYHSTLLTTSSPLPKPHLTNTLTLTLHYLAPPENSNTDYNPPPPPTRPVTPYSERQSKPYIRHHNCPCHETLTLPYSIGPDAVLYPNDYPYTHPPQLKHGCECHRDVDIDQDAFAARCAEQFARTELWEKTARGTAWPLRGWDRGVWGEWVCSEGGLVLCWEGCWKAVEGREGEFGGGDLVSGDEGREKEGSQGAGQDESDESMPDDGGMVGGEAGSGDADGMTLAGEEEDGDGWEVVSDQETVC